MIALLSDEVASYFPLAAYLGPLPRFYHRSPAQFYNLGGSRIFSRIIRVKIANL